MEFKHINTIYFSSTGSTEAIVKAIKKGTGLDYGINENLLYGTFKETLINKDELTIFAVPVFSGRVPAASIEKLNSFKGKRSPAIVVCVYGNRDFDDALLELKNIVENNGFAVVSAAAFIAEHSIFPKVASSRPDSSDMNLAGKFGADSLSAALTRSIDDFTLEVRGNFPYRPTKPIPLHPKTDNKCNSCGLCARQCPVSAIDIDNPKKMDKDKCITCSHCIAACPKGAKKYAGLLYCFASYNFTKKYMERKEPYIAI